jgi:hypothetical protein
MAVVDRNSSTIANNVAIPKVLNSPGMGLGRLCRVNGVVATAADDSATSVQRFCRIPSNATNISVQLSCADATTAGAINVGLYQTIENGSAVVDADLFAAAFVLTNGPYDHQEITFESGEYTLAESLTPLWSVLGLTSDPGIEYDVAQVISTTFNGGPTAMKLTVTYQQ